MKAFKNLLTVLLLYLLVIAPSVAMPVEQSNIERVKNIKTYNKFIIDEVEITDKYGVQTDKIVLKEKADFIKEKVLWEITSKLPLTTDQCDAAYAELCSASLNELYHDACYSPCISYGPKLAGFDEKNGYLYLVAPSASVGTGGGPYFLFVADVKKKEIKYLSSIFGPFKSELSSSGEYLVFYGGASIQVFNTKLKTLSVLSERNNQKPGQEIFHVISNFKWLSDTRFSYTDRVRHNKFQDTNDKLVEVIYDIPFKKIIQTKELTQGKTVQKAL